MTALYILGALLWTYVLVRLLRRITEQRAAQRAHLAWISEQQRLWQAEMDAEAESWRQLRHAQCMAVLDEVAALDAAGGAE